MNEIDYKIIIIIIIISWADVGDDETFDYVPNKKIEQILEPTCGNNLCSLKTLIKDISCLILYRGLKLCQMTSKGSWFHIIPRIFQI